MFLCYAINISILFNLLCLDLLGVCLVFLVFDVVVVVLFCVVVVVVAVVAAAAVFVAVVCFLFHFYLFF